MRRYVHRMHTEEWIPRCCCKSSSCHDQSANRFVQNERMPTFIHEQDLAPLQDGPRHADELLLACAEVLSPFGYVRVQISEGVGVHGQRTLLWRVFVWDQVNSAESFELGMTLLSTWLMVIRRDTYNFSILVLIEDVKRRAKGARQDGRVLC